MSFRMFNKKLQTLRTIYEWYGGIVESSGPWACERGCATCCTSSLVLTTLEAAYLWEGNSEHVKRFASTWPTGDCLTPLTMTTNQRAAYCMAKHDVGEEEETRTGEPCPLLVDDRCLCYDHRPLMCRLMNSVVRCEQTGCAEIGERILTLNTVLLQFVEHLDRPGWCGYLIDMLPCFRDPDFVTEYKTGSAKIEGPKLFRNHPNPGYIVPPNDQKAVRVWLKDLTRRIRG